MWVIQVVGTMAWSVQRTTSLRTQKNGDETYNVEGDNFGFQSIHASDVLVLPEELTVEAGQEIDPEWHDVALPLDRFLSLTPQMALADTLGMLLRTSVVEGSITDDDLLRIAPALAEREWHPGLVVVAGDVYCDEGLLYRCVQAHTTQADWKPGLLPALWRRVRPEATVEIWQVNTDYATDDIVGYPDEMALYRCKQGHTSQTGWEPPNIPALWEPHEA